MKAMEFMNGQGQRILKIVARLGLSIPNIGNTTTFRSVWEQTHWHRILLRVIEDYTESDHRWQDSSQLGERLRRRVHDGTLPNSIGLNCRPLQCQCRDYYNVPYISGL